MTAAQADVPDLRSVIAHPLAWMLRATCGPDTAELFHRPMGKEPIGAYIDRTTAAKAICARCPVQRECRAYALAHPELEGIWGGLAEHERQRRTGR